MTTEVDRTYDRDGNLVAEVAVKRPPALPSREDSVTLAARLTVVDKVRADEVSIADAVMLAPLFDEWEPGGVYVLGDVRRWDGALIRCLQGHTNHDPNHTPDTTPALWTVYRAAPAEEYPDWVQPDSTNPYSATWDDGSSPVIVKHNGRLWENTHGDGNVWAPGVYGWTVQAA